MILVKAIKRLDTIFVRGWLASRLMVDVPEETLLPWVRQVNEMLTQHHESDGSVGNGWSDGSCDLFLRKRISEANLYPECGCQGAMPDTLTVPLHVFFLYIHESEEHLKNLRREPTEETTKHLRVTTPAIERTMVKIKPIDKTAHAVAPVADTDTHQEVNH